MRPRHGFPSMPLQGLLSVGAAFRLPLCPIALSNCIRGTASSQGLQQSSRCKTSCKQYFEGCSFLRKVFLRCGPGLKQPALRWPRIPATSSQDDTQ